MPQEKRHANRLINETSPYLQQHAHNPVDWYPWGDEAFERARAEDKPLLVSIGYSACHWCHVMEHESFEDASVAAVQNEYFVNIKVDMEERPDVDQIYMNFVQITTGRGGWPMNVFITPDKLPFFGGTYFPPEPRYGMPSWRQILLGIADAWNERRDELMTSANDILGELRRMTVSEFPGGALDQSLSDAAFQSFVRSFDAKNGGFGGSPKFPPSMALEFLLRYWKRTGNENAFEMVRKTAEKMAKGGIYDQLGGGFHRYSVDAVWLVPHFEKMLYDNAQLIKIYLHLYQATEGEEAEFFKRIAVETLEYVRREMLDDEGGFYSSQDADSEGEEGKFFVWTPAEIAEVLGQDAAEKFSVVYDVTDSGNFEGKSILNIPDLDLSNSSKFQVDPAQLAEWRQKLFVAREARIKPFRDEKILTAWNGLMLSAFAEAAAVFDEPAYLDIARRNADFLLSALTDRDGGGVRLLRTWKDGRAKLNGYIEDYANLADGAIELYQASGDAKYLHAGRELADAMITEFWDEEAGGFFFTANDHEELIVRNKDFVDNATPSGNSAAADVMLRLAKFYGEEKYERFALTVLRLASGQIKRFPNGFGRSLAALEFHLAATKEIAIAADPGGDLEREIWKDYRPFRVLAVGTEPNGVPLLEDRTAVEGKPAAYVCEDFVCQRPVTTAAEIREII